jgi:hypothetical protein
MNDQRGDSLWDAAADHLFSAFAAILLQSATGGGHLNK